MKSENDVKNSLDGVTSLTKNFSMIFMQDINKYTISSKNGNYTEITKTEDSDLVNSKYDNNEYKYTIDDIGDVDFYKLLRQHKLYGAYNVNHIIPNIIERKDGQITRLQLGAAKAELAIPEDIVVVCIENSAYIHVGDNLYMELHGSKTEDKFVAIDYCAQNISVMKSGEVLQFAEFSENPENLLSFGSDHYKIEYLYDGGVISDIKIGFENSQYEFDVFSYRADILNEDGTIEKIIGINPIPYIIKDDDIIEFSQDHLLYMSYIIEFNEDEEVEVYNKYYQEFTLVEAESVKDFWEGLIKAETE